MTKLEALNIILDGIGVYPVTSFDSSHPDAVRARQALFRFDTEIQSRGWWFNQEIDLQLNPNNENKILLPSNTLVVNPVSPRDRYVQRGTFLYDSKNHTYTFSDPVRVNIVSQLDFTELPESIQSYIARSGEVEFAIVREGDQNKIAKIERMLYTARSLAYSDELRNGNYNVFNSSLPARVIGGFSPAVRRF